jgi:hypothetical protein
MVGRNGGSFKTTLIWVRNRFFLKIAVAFPKLRLFFDSNFFSFAPINPAA